MFNDSAIKYKEEKSTAFFQGKTITVTHFTPILSPEEREKRRKEIEHSLYNIFKKYA